MQRGSSFRPQAGGASRLRTAAMLLALVPAGPLAAQEVLVANRPGFSNVAEVVPRGRFEANLGVGWAREGEEEALALGQVLLRTGLGSRLELRVGLDSWVDVRSPTGDYSGFEDSALGLKIGLARGADGFGFGRPQASLILQALLPTGSDELTAHEIEPAAIAVLAWDLGPRVHLDSNFGAAWRGAESGRHAELSTSFAFSVALGGDWSTYLEYAGFFPTGSDLSASHFLFAAMTRLVGPDTQIDLGGGRGLDREDPRYFLSAGIAHRW